MKFQSTLPAKGETRPYRNYYAASPFQSTLPAKGETSKQIDPQNKINISIHSPSEGRDRSQGSTGKDKGNFNPLSQRRERPFRSNMACPSIFISIHSPSEGRDLTSWTPPKPRSYISIHSPSEGRDTQDR